jgi:DNA segregation ATPase FtsK/SpoIIIE-like protein
MFEDGSQGLRKRGSSVVRREFETQNFKKNINEFFFMGFGFSLLFLLVALFSYSPLDNSFFFFNSEKSSFDNMCGAFGAHCAATLFFFLGSVAYFVVGVLMAAWGYRFSRPQEGNYTAWFAGGAVLFTLFMGMFTHLFNVCSGPGVAALRGVSAFDAMVRVIGPVGVGMGLALGLLCSLAFLFDMSVAQMATLSTLVLQVTLIALRHALSWVRAMALRGGQLSLVALHVVWAAAKKALTPAQMEVKEQSYEKRFEEQIIIHDPVFVTHDDLEILDEEDDPNIARASAASFEPAKVQAKPLDDVSDVLIPADLYEPSRDRTFKFGSFTLNLLPVAPFYTNIFKHPEFIRLFETRVVAPQFSLPDDSLLIEEHARSFDREAFEVESKERAVQLEEKLRHFGINGSVVAVRPGPVITLFEYQPDIDVKINSIIAREDDLAMVLKALSIRIVAPIPGTSVVGFEIANATREDVFMSDLIVGEAWKKTIAALPLLLGVDSTGNTVVHDLATMPHLLVAGSTGSGKSVCMHSILFSLLSKHTPETLRLILVDPKRLEFAAYAEIPHLLFPIVVEPSKTVGVLKWAVAEMEYRYKMMAQAGVRNIGDYNKRCTAKGESALPYLVVMIDELADLMMVAGRDIELQLIRIAQMARAAGIHMVIATQRPSVDVVTGLIKVNFPSRLGCRVSSKIDSRTILDTGGAEKLLGRGDMLFLHGSSSSLRRLHGAYVSDTQVERLTDFLRSLGKPEYISLDEAGSSGASFGANDQDDELYGQVLEAIKTLDDVSISLLQRRFRIGFNRAARLMEQLEADGMLAPAQSSGKARKVLRLE